jgi:hypothetical protein
MGEDYLMYPTDFLHERQAGEFATFQSFGNAQI